MFKKKKKKNLNAGTISEEEKNELCLEIVKVGERLGKSLMIHLADFGESPEGLLIETYAMAKAYGALKAIAEEKAFEVDKYFQLLLPDFVEEFKELVRK